MVFVTPDLGLVPEQVANAWAPWVQDPQFRVWPRESGWTPSPTDTPPPAPLDAAAWRDLLLDDLLRQRREIQVPREYFRGEHRLRFLTDKYRETFGRLFGDATDNWCRLVVSAAAERLRVAGIRMNGDAADSDDDAWRIWQSSFLDADSGIAHTDAMVCGVAFLLAHPDERTGAARITVENPWHSVVRVAPGDRRRRLAALKHYKETDGRDVAWVYLPDLIVAFSRESQTGPWKELSRHHNPLGEVPMVPMVNSPDSTGDGMSDLLEVIPTQDAINKFGIDVLVASEYASFHQKVIMGWDPSAAAELVSAESRVWAFSSPDVKIGEFSPSQIDATLAARAKAIESLSARTRTPPHYLLGQMVNVSGDALKAAETGLVAKVRERQAWFGEAWEEALRLALRLDGRDVTGTERAELVWMNPESRSDSQLADSLVKLRDAGFPITALYQIWGATPTEIEAWSRELGLPERASRSGSPPASPDAP